MDVKRKEDEVTYMAEMMLEPAVWESLPSVVRDYFGIRGGFELERHCGIILLRFSDPLEAALLTFVLAGARRGVKLDIIAFVE